MTCWRLLAPRWRPLVVCALLCCATLIVSSAGRAQPAEVSAEEHFKYASIGIEEAEGLPYWIWKVLPKMFQEKLPGPGGYAAFGIISEEGKDLPIGFAKKRIGGIDRVAVTCAFCHTAIVRVSPEAKPMIVPGAPSHQLDSQAYVRFLQACAADPRFNGKNVLAAIDELTDLSWWTRLKYRWFYIPAVRTALAKQKRELAWMDKQPTWGRGRIDPFNRAKFSYLRQPQDGTIGNSDMMPIWNMRARKGLALHWDGLNGPLREVVLSSALGDGATPKSIDLKGLARVEDWLMDLPPAKYPFPIDASLANAGGQVFRDECARCHAFGGERTGKTIPIAEIGTDRHRLDMWTRGATDAYNTYGDKYPWDFKAFRKTDGYVAVPLDGVWLRAPYLHNGSVPSLYDLLDPPDKRPRTFIRGYDVYNPARVGFVSSGADAERVGFRYDTAQPGNSNAGHAYGLELSDDRKRALVEYLKTL